jgi:hypothetical protein
LVDKPSSATDAPFAENAQDRKPYIDTRSKSRWERVHLSVPFNGTHNPKYLVRGERGIEAIECIPLRPHTMPASNDPVHYECSRLTEYDDVTDPHIP